MRWHGMLAEIMQKFYFCFQKEHVRTLIPEEIKNIIHSLLLKAHPY